MFKHLKRYVSHFLLTWYLWKHLLHPPEHPVFRRTIKTTYHYKLPLPIIWFALIVASFSCYSLWVVLLNFKVSIAVLLPLTMLLFSCTYVVLWISNICLTLIKEQEQRTYDTMSISPLGALGANWAICTAILHRHDTLAWLDFVRRLLSGLILFILLIVLLTIAFIKEDALNIWQPLGLLLDIAALTFMAYADHVQSVVLGSLIALLLPHYIRNSNDVHIWAVFVFITLQSLAFIIFLAVMLMLKNLTPDNHYSIVVGLLLFYALREVMIYVAWYTLAYHLNGNLAELDNSANA
jgi:hypothetical protein